MPSYTEHYNLIKPNKTENYNINVANTNNEVIDEELYKKVEKIPGKELSTNDFTNAYKQMLDNLKIPTNNNELENGAGYLTKTQVSQLIQLSLLEINGQIEVLLRATEQNDSELLATKQFIENSMKTLEKEGTSIHVSDSADYPCQLRVEGKSEQLQTEQSANLADANVLYKDMESFNNEDLSEKTVDSKECIEFKNSLYRNDQGFIGLEGNYKENTQYTVRGLFRISDTSLTSGKKIYFGAVYTDNTRKTVATEANGENWIELRIVTELNKTLKGVYFTYDQVSLWLLDKDSLCIIEGDVTEYPAFVPDSPSPNYPSKIENVSGDLEIKVVRQNLFMKQGLSTPIGTENFWDSFTNTTPLEDGWCRVEVNNTGTSTMFANQFIKRGNIDKIKPDTDYIIWAEFKNIKTNNTNNYVDLCGYSSMSIWRNNATLALNSENKKIIKKVRTKVDISNATLDLRNYVSVAVGTSVNLEYRMMILEDIYTDEELQKITYEDYSSQSVTFPFAEGQKLMKDGYLGDEGIHNKRIQIVSTGNEYWSKRTGKNNSFNLTLNNKAIKGICNTYKSFTSPTEIDTKDGIYLLSSSYAIVTDLRFTDVTEFKNWLAEQYTNGTPVIIEYEVEKEEVTPYTEEQQTTYNELKKLKTYRTVTNISNSQNTNMKLTYKMDLQTQFQELEALVLESGV